MGTQEVSGRVPTAPGSQPSASAAGASSPIGADPSRGGWYAGDNEEFFRVGPCLTKEEALAEAHDYFGPEHRIYLLQAEVMQWSPPSAASVIDMMIDNSDELFFEDGFDDMVGSKAEIAAAEADLDALLADWLARHRAIFPTPTTFGWMGERETIEPAIDICPDCSGCGLANPQCADWPCERCGGAGGILRDSDGSGEADETQSGSAVGDSAGRETVSPNTQVSETPSDTLGEKADV